MQSFEASSSEVWEMEFSAPQTYLFEPNAAIQKSGLFAQLAHQTQTKKNYTQILIFLLLKILFLSLAGNFKLLIQWLLTVMI